MLLEGISDMIEKRIEGKKVEIFKAREFPSPAVFLNTFSDNSKEIYGHLLSLTDRPFSLIAISSLDWNRDMSPWTCASISRNSEPLSGGADSYLDLLLSRIVPDSEMILGTVSKRIIAGYSLAGLFAVYSLYRTDVFSRLAVASASLWFPGFRDFVLSNEMKAAVDKMYFSLGDRERLTSNPYLRTVEDVTREIVEHYRELGIDTEFMLNPGNHYKDATGRMARAILSSLE